MPALRSSRFFRSTSKIPNLSKLALLHAGSIRPSGAEQSEVEAESITSRGCAAYLGTLGNYIPGIKSLRKNQQSTGMVLDLPSQLERGCNTHARRKARTRQKLKLNRRKGDHHESQHRTELTYDSIHRYALCEPGTGSASSKHDVLDRQGGR